MRVKAGARPAAPSACRLRAGAVVLTLTALVALCAAQAASAATAKDEDLSHTAALTAFGLGARPLGMGGAFAAVADDANALYYNPGGLSTLQEVEMTSMYASQFGLLNTYAAGYTQDGWGAGLLRYQLGDIERRDEFANEVGDRFSVGEQMLIGSYAATVDPVDIGLSLKYYSQTLADVSGSGVTIDRYNVQYAYEQPSVLDGTHRLSFGMRF